MSLRGTAINDMLGLGTGSRLTFNDMIKYSHLVGSRATCNPPPTNTDEDYLILLKEGLDYFDVHYQLLKEGWELGGSMIYPAEKEESYDVAEYGFNSFRKGNINYIITASEVFYAKFMFATKVCKDNNFLIKEERVAVFQAVLYDNAPLVLEEYSYVYDTINIAKEQQ